MGLSGRLQIEECTRLKKELNQALVTLECIESGEAESFFPSTSPSKTSAGSINNQNILLDLIVASNNVIYCIKS